ncbi:MAG: hypothetical protein RLY82_518, partial [Pseudomonadota bacterium]
MKLIRTLLLTLVSASAFAQNSPAPQAISVLPPVIDITPSPVQKG